MDEEYQLNEVPSTSDPKAIYFFYLFQEFINPVNELIQKINSSKHTSKTTIGLVMPILFRLIECSQSIAILLSKHRIRDAGILLLNAYELRLDLLYISLDSTREEKWIDCETKNRKPWKVSKQLTEIFTSVNDLKAEKDIYKHYSMIKHGNNAGGHSSFPISLRSYGFIFTEKNSDGIGPHLSILCGFLYSAVNASFVILEKHNNQFEDLKKIIDQKYSKIKNASVPAITDMVYEMVFQKYPHLKEIPDIKKRLRIDMHTDENDELKIEATLLNKKV
jgi:hypothetical protein